MLMIEHAQIGPSYYDLLGVKKDANQKEIKKAFRRLSKLHHPDTGGDLRIFQAISEAYEILSDPEKRFIYDRMNFSKQEMARILEICVKHLINTFAKGTTTQKQIRSIVKGLIETEIGALVKHKTDVEKGTALVDRILAEIDNEDNTYITKLVIENLESKKRGNKQGLAMVDKDIKLLEAALEFMDKINLKKKDIAQYTWNFNSGTANSSSTANLGPTIIIQTG